MGRLTARAVHLYDNLIAAPHLSATQNLDLISMIQVHFKSGRILECILQEPTHFGLKPASPKSYLFQRESSRKLEHRPYPLKLCNERFDS